MSILDELAPLKTGHRSGPRHSKNWLSPMAIEAKKRRRRLERRWKSSNEETDRLAYRASCRSANALITESRIAANLERINEASKNPRSLWSSIKTLLHSSLPSERLRLAHSCILPGFCYILALEQMLRYLLTYLLTNSHPLFQCH